MSRVDWDYFDKFERLTNFLVPKIGEGFCKATQIATAVCKLIYKWYNDGDVYDNVHSQMKGWANDLSSYANWLWKNTDDDVRNILDGISDADCDEDYENILKDLADKCFDCEWIKPYAGMLIPLHNEGNSIYDCDGPFEYTDHPGIPDTVGIDYDSSCGEFVINDEYGDQIEGGFSTLSDAISWCEENNVEYDTTAEAEERDGLPDFVCIEWDDNRERFIVVGDDGEIYEMFDYLCEAEEWCDDRSIEYEVYYEAELKAEEMEAEV